MTPEKIKDATETHESTDTPGKYSSDGVLSNPEMEQATLGACLLNRDSLGECLEILKPRDFHSERHKTLFENMSALYSDNYNVDLITLSERLNEQGILDRCGGIPYLTELMDAVTTTANAPYYANTVHDLSIRRQIIRAANRIANLGRKFDRNIPGILDEAQNLLFSAGQNSASNSSNNLTHVRSLTGPVVAQLEQRQEDNGSFVTGYLTGFQDFDNLTGGLQPGSLNILAARPSMGKTALALNIAQFGGGRMNKPVLIFSLEMPSDQLIQRMISAQSGVDLSRLTRGLLSTMDFDAIKTACDKLTRRNIYISDATQLSATEFRARCRRFMSRYQDVGLVVVDYLQLMSAGDKRTESRNQEVADISRMLKATARDLNAPVIALSQLSRDAEKRPDKRPQLSDLRDSGAIEQDADLVLMLYREDYYSQHENDDLTDSKADIRIAKNRNGTTGVFHLTFRREVTRFYDYGRMR